MAAWRRRSNVIGALGTLVLLAGCTMAPVTVDPDQALQRWVGQPLQTLLPPEAVAERFNRLMLEEIQAATP